MASACVVADVLDQRASGIQRQHSGEETRRMPANGPGVIAACDLILEHRREGMAAVEVESARQSPRAQLLEQEAAIGVEVSPSAGPSSPAPAIGAAEKERVAKRCVDRIAVGMHASDLLSCP